MRRYLFIVSLPLEQRRIQSWLAEMSEYRGREQLPGRSRWRRSAPAARLGYHLCVHWRDQRQGTARVVGWTGARASQAASKRSWRVGRPSRFVLSTPEELRDPARPVGQSLSDAHGRARAHMSMRTGDPSRGHPSPVAAASQPTQHQWISGLLLPEAAGGQGSRSERTCPAGLDDALSNRWGGGSAVRGEAREARRER